MTTEITNWNNLPDVSSQFKDKIDEISNQLKLIDILTSSHQKTIHYEKNKEYKIKPNDTHPLKAGLVLMIYNFIESISTALMNDLYMYAENNILNKTSNKLENLLKQHWIKVTKKPDSQKNEWFNGNVDMRKLEKALSPFYQLKEKSLRCQELESIKEQRNKLAHGGESFTDFGRGQVLEKIKKQFEKIQEFYTALFTEIDDYLSNLENSFQSLPPVVQVLHCQSCAPLSP